MAVNRRSFDWESLQILVSGKPVMNVKSVDFSDTRGVSPVYGAGGSPIAWGRRNYRAQGSIELADDDYALFHTICAAQGGLYYASFDLMLNYGNNSLSNGYPDRHIVTLSNCMVSRRGGASRQGAAEARIMRIEMEILNGIHEFNHNILDLIR